MPINSIKKGKRGERELAAVLRSHGFEARRGQQFKGGDDSPDVVHNIPGIHIECKFTERFKLYDALDQAERDRADGETPIVAHRMNNRRWVAVLSLDDLINILKRCPTNLEN